MPDPYREQIERFLNDELPADEAERFSELIDSDPRVSRLFDQMALESVFRPLEQKTLSFVENAPANPALEKLIQRQLAQSRRAELWSLRTNEGDEPHALFDKTRRIAATAVRAVRDDSGNHVKECELRVAIERVGNQPPSFRLSCDWPAGYEPMGIKLSRLKMLDRKPFEQALRFQSLADEIAARPAPAGDPGRSSVVRQNSMTLSAATADADPLLSDSGMSTVEERDRNRPTFHEAGFRVQCDLRQGTIRVSAAMPSGRTTDFIVSEIEYTGHDGQPAIKREAVRMEPSSSDATWSRWAQVGLPNPDDCSSPRVTLRFRSMRDSDLYLLNANELDDVFAENDAMLLPATKLEPGSFEFSADFNFQREDAATSDVTWSLQMARQTEEVGHG